MKPPGLMAKRVVGKKIILDKNLEFGILNLRDKTDCTP